MDFISSLHHARESKRRVVCVASQCPSFSGSSVDALFQARAARASAKRDTLPFTVVAVDSAAQVRRSTAVPVVAETPCSDYINGLRRSRAARTIGFCVRQSSPQIGVPRIPVLHASPCHHLCASSLSASPVPQVLSVPVSDHPLCGDFLRRSTLPPDLSCANTRALRKAVIVRRAALQPLDTEKARRSLQLHGRSQNKLQELQRGVVRAALALANIIPPYALEQLLDVNLQTVPITAGIDAVIALIEGKGISAPYLTDIVNSWKSLLADIDQRGVFHFERARAFDVNLFLKMRDSQARANFVKTVLETLRVFSR